jgi:uroporphyrinogen decarboxylase
MTLWVNLSNSKCRLPTDLNNDLTYVFDGVSTIKKALNNRVPLIGFSGSPWTLAGNFA